MDTSPQPGSEQDYLGKALDIAIRLSLIALIVISCFKIFSPFAMAILWGSIIAIALLPVFEKLESALGGRRKLAGVVFVLLCLIAVLVPALWLGDSLLDGTVRLVKEAESGKLNIPAPTDKVQTWPVVGEKLYALWQSAHLDLEGTMAKLQPQLGEFGKAVLRGVSGLGRDLVQSLFAILIAGVLMVMSSGVGRALRTLLRRLAGASSNEIADMTVSTVRSVVKGVILVALIQSLAAAVGMKLAGVPAAGLWALFVMILAVVQIPPLLVLGPVAIWVFANNDSTVISVVFLIWSILVSVSDGFLKPLFLGRGVQVPMLVILVGAIGGVMQAGILGLFIGPVILAIAYELLKGWLAEVDGGEQAPAASVDSSA